MKIESSYAVVLKGGSIGGTRGYFDKVGKTSVSVSESGLDKETAKIKAKRLNSFLSKGEKEYYKMKYYSREFSKLEKINS